MELCTCSLNNFVNKCHPNAFNKKVKKREKAIVHNRTGSIVTVYSKVSERLLLAEGLRKGSQSGAATITLNSLQREGYMQEYRWWRGPSRAPMGAPSVVTKPRATFDLHPPRCGISNPWRWSTSWESLPVFLGVWGQR